jgi:hypothetical protein
MELVVPPRTDNGRAAVGFRVKSGWAAAILLQGPVEAPQVLDQRKIELCDPAVPESRQPYHAAMGKLETDNAKITRRRTVVTQAAERSVEELLAAYRSAGHTIGAAALVVGSVIDPAKITNPHIRAHALEGQLFRTVLEDALRSHGLACSVFVERTIYKQAAKILQRSEQNLKRLMTQLGQNLDGPWRADEKTACLAAWLTLAEAPRSEHTIPP